MAKQNEQIESIIEGIDFSNLTPEQMVGEGGLIQQFSKRLIETAMKAEMEDQLGYGKNDISPKTTANRRNGRSKKFVKTPIGEIEIDVPRDRDSEFEPKIVPKHQRHFDLFNDNIIYLYGKGMSTRDIRDSLREIYKVDVSPELISRVTDAILDDVREWQTRPLDEMYPIVFFDALVVKGRSDGKVINKSVYLALGINMEGQKEVLGMWIAETESASFWLNVITDLNNRGLKDILIASIDGLKGFPEAIKSVFSKTHIQGCIVHMIRNSTKHVSYKDRKVICADLKKIYKAPTEKEGQLALEDFAQKWDSRFPMISKSWKENWENLNEMFRYPEPIRKVIYTTNAIESLNSSLRKVLKKRSAFPTDDAIYKVLYLALTNASKKWSMPIRDWGLAINQFAIYFEGRVKL